MCATDEEEIQTSCCYEVTTGYMVTIASETPVCCQSEFVYNKVEDEFVNNKSELNFNSSVILYQAIELTTYEFGFSSEPSFYSDSSPPFFTNSEVHIVNSVFLI